MNNLISGTLSKMPVHLTDELHPETQSNVHYSFKLFDLETKEHHQTSVLDLLGKSIKIEYRNDIFCTNCGRKTKKSFGQGHCYPCFQSLPECDMCIMSPEKCHFHLGTCRDEAWGKSFCFQPHVVYLSNTSSIKVGITRHTQIPTRWIDQGAVQAIPIATVTSRFASGLTEDFFKAIHKDKTSWQKMLKTKPDPMDMIEQAQNTQNYFTEHFELDDYRKQHISMMDISLTPIDDKIHDKICNITYPVLEYPTKVKSHNLEKTPIVEGQLLGIKGQYLILDTGVINIRKYTGYDVDIRF